MSGEGLSYNGVCVNEVEGEAFRNLIIKNIKYLMIIIRGRPEKI